MSSWSRIACLLTVTLALVACGEQPASDLTIERLEDVDVNLPDVPTLPPPPFEVQYTDLSLIHI